MILEHEVRQTVVREQELTALRSGLQAGRRVQGGMCYHFVGIGGCGMSGLAEVLAQRGHRISGSDVQTSRVIERLAGRGIAVGIGHGVGNLPGHVDCLVISAAVKADNPEVRWASEHGVRVCKYAELLGELSAAIATYAVAGTHGKSTTSGCLAFVLKESGLDPGFVVGADVGQLGGGSGAGKGATLVVEACEYDRSFLNLHPRAAAILNIEGDHYDYYHDLNEIVEAFGQFAAQIQPGGLLVAPARDANVAKALAGPIKSRFQVENDLRLETFALDVGSGVVDWYAEDFTMKQGCGRFILGRRGRRLGEVRLLLAGRHNVANALAAAALAYEAGAEGADICAALSAFTGVGRRMTCKGEVGGVIVLDDYAHHPTEIRVTLEAIQRRYAPRRLWCVFQPHQHSRTRFLLDDFALSFGEADVVLLPDIYFVRDSEAQRREINAAMLAERISENGPEAHYLSRFDEILDYLAGRMEAGDVVVTMGAGDIWKLGDELICRFGRNSQE